MLKRRLSINKMMPLQSYLPLLPMRNITKSKTKNLRFTMIFRLIITTLLKIRAKRQKYGKCMLVKTIRRMRIIQKRLLVKYQQVNLLRSEKKTITPILQGKTKRFLDQKTQRDTFKNKSKNSKSIGKNYKKRNSNY